MEKEGSLPLKLFRSLEDARTTGIRLHHIAFRTDCIEDAVKALVACGARVLEHPAPREAFRDEPIAFLSAGGLTAELVTIDEWRDRIVERPTNAGQVTDRDKVIFHTAAK